jgi:hypothetical protein
MSSATRIVDVPCGDMNWMGTLLPLLKEAGVKYLGMDVVGDVGERFAGLNNRMRMRRKGEMNLTYFFTVPPSFLPAQFKGTRKNTEEKRVWNSGNLT